MSVTKNFRSRAGRQIPAGSEEEMRYALYFVWNDGTKDSFNVNSARERDLNIIEVVDTATMDTIHEYEIRRGF